LGNQYLSIEPGSSPDKIKPGGEIENTQGSVDLIGLLGKAVFSATGAGGK
jgi:phospholipid/cholesterol/gamma-HCH transport system substrate-binding protein